MKAKLTQATILRLKAEELLKNKSKSSENKLSTDEILKLVHELDVYHVELEMQNEELLMVKNKTEAEAEKYTNLYDFAPSAYFSLSEEGEILELNFKTAELLGKERTLLLKNHFGLFILSETRPIFNQFLEKTFKTNNKENCEIILSTNSNIPTYVYLNGLVTDDRKRCNITMIDITKRKTAELELLNSELILKTTIDSQKDTIIFSFDTKYNYLTYNKTHADAMKQIYNADIKKGMNIIECISNEEDKKNAKENFDRALQGESHTNIKIFGDIEKVHFESFFNPIIDTNNNIIGATGLARDISNRIKNEEALKKSEEKHKNLFNSNRDSITIFRINHDGKPGNFIESNPATTSLFGYTKKEILSMSILDLEKVTDTKSKKRIDSLKSKGKIDFETAILHKNGMYRTVEFESFLINYLNEPAVMNIARDITERKLTEDIIRKAQENLSTILEAIPDILFEVGIDGRIYYYQTHRKNLLALPPSKFMGKTFQEVLPADVSKTCLEAIEEADKKGWSLGKQYTLNLKEGKHWFEISVSPIKDKNILNKHFILIARDITERKMAEEKLRVEKERIRTILDLVGNPIFLKDNDHKITYANNSFYNLFGLDEKSVIGKTLAENVPENERKHFLKIDRNVLDTGIQDVREEKLTLKGVERTIITSKTRFIDESGNKSLVGSIYDITDRKETEKKLKLTSEKFQNLVDSTGGIVWEADATRINFNFVSQEAERLLGFPVEDWYKEGFWANQLHPDDKKETIEYCLLQTKLMQKHDFKYRFKTRKGNYVWLRDIVNVVSENGKPKWLRGVMFDITEQVETIQSLLESEEKYRRLVENSPDAIVIYVDDKIAFINDGGLRMFGAKNSEEIIGKPVLQFIHPESKKSIIQKMNDIAINDFPLAIIEEKLIGLKGNTIEVELRAIPTIFEHKAAVQVIIHDITQQNRTQEKIRQLSQAVEQSPVTIIITNTKGEIEYVNPKFTETTGYTLKEVINQNPRILKSEYTKQEEYKELWKTLSLGKEWHGEFQNKKKDGNLYWESAFISPIVNSLGKTTHYIAIKEDITERKIAEQELIQAKFRAEESDRLKLAFLANMSHEIRTPMNGILGFTELLKEPHLTGKEQKEYINIIEKSGIRMLNIINDIISISKVESGQIEVSITKTNINEQIEYLNTFFKPETKQKGIQLLATRKLPSEDCFALTDKEKLYAVLTNLVKNAIKFTNEGTIEFGCVKKDDYLEFFVKDTGMGISKKQQDLIFERFRQANESMTRSHEGSGLGLAISKAYIEMLGGTIWVKSNLGKGSTFYFTIPFDTEFKPEENDTIQNVNSVSKEENKVKDLKVLIVEDDAISKLLITIAVKPYSKEILKVNTGFEAIEACKNNQDIDLVMMDINMPEMGGYEATKHIREFNKKLVIIAQTANGMQSDHDNAIAAGCTDYISKPINITALGELIQKYFKK